MTTPSLETAFSMETSSIKFGPGVTREVGFEMRRLGARRVMVVTDPGMTDSEPVRVAASTLRAEGIDPVLFDQVEVEPTDVSFKEAIGFAIDGNFDGYVAVGGGSSMDTAKAANLYATYPAEFLAYVNAPIGQARQVARSAQASDSDSYDGRHGQRDNRRRHLRPPRDARQDGHIAQGASSGHGDRGPGQHPHSARHGRGLHRVRRAQPRAGVVYRDAVSTEASP